MPLRTFWEPSPLHFDIWLDTVDELGNSQLASKHAGLACKEQVFPGGFKGGDAQASTAEYLHALEIGQQPHKISGQELTTRADDRFVFEMRED